MIYNFNFLKHRTAENNRSKRIYQGEINRVKKHKKNPSKRFHIVSLWEQKTLLKARENEIWKSLTSNNSIVFQSPSHNHNGIVKRSFCLFNKLFGTTSQNHCASFCLRTSGKNVIPNIKYNNKKKTLVSLTLIVNCQIISVSNSLGIQSAFELTKSITEQMDVSLIFKNVRFTFN